ncbi:MAG: hypothetical protein PHE09_12690 [Oscillospiraceae bacterium]|nr:hypothetical protein [Oscillospiraceae bacterium]
MPDGTKKIVCGKSIAALKAVEDTLRDAKYLLGHESISVTADIYTHIGAADSVGTASVINDYFKKLKSSQKVVNPQK